MAHLVDAAAAAQHGQQPLGTHLPIGQRFGLLLGGLQMALQLPTHGAKPLFSPDEHLMTSTKLVYQLRPCIRRSRLNVNRIGDQHFNFQFGLLKCRL